MDKPRLMAVLPQAKSSRFCEPTGDNSVSLDEPSGVAIKQIAIAKRVPTSQVIRACVMMLVDNPDILPADRDARLEAVIAEAERMTYLLRTMDIMATGEAVGAAMEALIDAHPLPPWLAIFADLSKMVGVPAGACFLAIATKIDRAREAEAKTNAEGAGK